MTTYIALLRGINVGKKQIKMDVLKSIMESLPVQKVQTYIQSGNVVFQAQKKQTKLLSEEIGNKLADSLSFDVPVIVRTMDELDEVIGRNPFASNGNDDEGKLYIAFLANEPAAESIQHLLSFQNGTDELRVQGKEVYLWCRTNYGTTQFSNAFLEKKLKVTATTRNWQTVNKLAAMCRA
ncbi:DUF1697 domain-containing protein [Paenibacillus sepulcri]|uniref:DUF1697 domain-containing protein n=1 Tax=Paenibacillus sepulcri TaxID=359917 RepID=A0ABS7C0L7_9BACL|nr:DUF1697 domain-containing protein [Paenibacillus sepulcri]